MLYILRFLKWLLVMLVTQTHLVTNNTEKVMALHNRICRTFKSGLPIWHGLRGNSLYNSYMQNLTVQRAKMYSICCRNFVSAFNEYWSLADWLKRWSPLPQLIYEAYTHASVHVQDLYSLPLKTCYNDDLIVYSILTRPYSLLILCTVTMTVSVIHSNTNERNVIPLARPMG